jgi:hypothetical protein
MTELEELRERVALLEKELGVRKQTNELKTYHDKWVEAHPNTNEPVYIPIHPFRPTWPHYPIHPYFGPPIVWC